MDFLNRIQPHLPPGAYRTYQILAPLATHWRPASCDEIDCRAYRLGWTTTVDERTDRGAAQAHYIRRQSGRGFVEHRTDDGLTAFRFHAGQRCFAATDHRMRLDRDEIFLRRAGDWRGNPTGEVVQHSGALAWRDDFGDHQQRLAEQAERG